MHCQLLTISFISESVTEIQNRYMHIRDYVSFLNAVSELSTHDSSSITT
jgi:hypothetical protein